MLILRNIGTEVTRTATKTIFILKQFLKIDIFDKEFHIGIMNALN